MKTEQMTKNGSRAVESILHKVKLMSFFWLIITTDGPPPRPKSWPASRAARTGILSQLVKRKFAAQTNTLRASAHIQLGHCIGRSRIQEPKESVTYRLRQEAFLSGVRPPPRFLVLLYPCLRHPSAVVAVRRGIESALPSSRYCAYSSL
jgi:hypothetical protein